MPMRLINQIPRRHWAAVGMAAIILSHLSLFIPSTASDLLPVVITAVCVMCSQRHVAILTSAAIGSVVLIGLIKFFYDFDWSNLLLVAVAEGALGAARFAFVLSPHGPIRTQERLSNRLRRQSAQLQAAIESQESTERTVQQFESDRRALLEHLPVHVVQKDQGGRFTFVSKSFCDLLQRDFADIIGKTDHDLFPEETACKFVEDDKRVMTSGQVFNDVESTQLPNGEMSFMQVRKAPLLSADGRLIGVQGIFWDVTEEFVRRQALRRIEALAHALINAALDAVLIVDDEGRVLEANPASEKILGYTPEHVASHPLLGTIMHTTLEEPAGRHSDPKDANTRVQRKASINAILKAATGKRIEARLRRSNEVWFEAEISAHPLDVEGEQNWAIFIRDITQRKRAEQELRAAKETAEHANATKSEFVANVSHELRTPLTGIIGLHELLANDEVTQRQQHYLDLAKISAANLLTLIDDLLDFSKIEAGHIEIETIEFSLIECVEETAASLAARAQLRGLELLIDFQANLPEMLISDPYRIKQILLNLIGNAIKFTEKGDIRVRVLLANEEPDHELRVNEAASTDEEVLTADVASLRFEVHDSGIGIPLEQREQIFEAFHQADASTTRRYGGTGLGLTICRDLAFKMGGRIGIEDSRRLSGEVSHGSCFFFELSMPIAKTSAVVSRTPPANQASQDVVLAANHCPWRELLYRELTGLGYRVTLLSVAELAARKPAHLFVAGNNTIVVVDFRELSSHSWTTAPVVRKWILLTPLVNSQSSTLPQWLNHAHIHWLSRPVCRRQLQQALSFESTPTAIANLSSKSESRRSANLLLVEDSPISQTVIKDMLQSLGHRVSIASTGREAIEACGARLFDLVLMDIQMPDMDGLDATRAIRQREQSTHKRQFIYALTAHATARDRAQCELASMDGFLVKPISRESLDQAVQNVTNRQPAAQEGAAKPQSDAGGAEVTSEGFPVQHLLTHQEAFAKEPTWAQLVELMHDNESLLRDVLSLLVREGPRLGRSFEAGLLQGNFNEARRAVHTLKSNVRYVGLQSIGEYAQWLEHLARDQQTAILQAHCDNLVSLANAVADWAAKLLKTHA